MTNKTKLRELCRVLRLLDKLTETDLEELVPASNLNAPMVSAHIQVIHRIRFLVESDPDCVPTEDIARRLLMAGERSA